MLQEIAQTLQQQVYTRSETKNKIIPNRCKRGHSCDYQGFESCRELNHNDPSDEEVKNSLSTKEKTWGSSRRT